MSNYRSLHARNLHDPPSEHVTLEDTGLDYFRIKPQDYERMMDAKSKEEFLRILHGYMDKDAEQQNSQSAVTTERRQCLSNIQKF
jgi:hypothetical protein